MKELWEPRWSVVVKKAWHPMVMEESRPSGRQSLGGEGLAQSWHGSVGSRMLDLDPLGGSCRLDAILAGEGQNWRSQSGLVPQRSANRRLPSRSRRSRDSNT
jgi:hypothetical protein